MKKWIRCVVLPCILTQIGLFAGTTVTHGQQTRDQKVRADRDQLADDFTWYYDDLDKGMAAAKKRNQPLMVVLRCIP